MRFDSPLRTQHADWCSRQGKLLDDRIDASERPREGAAVSPREFQVSYLPYGPAQDSEATCEIVAAFGPVEPEYASLRRDCGLLDAPHRTSIQLTGSERLDFLDRMLTQQVGTLAPGGLTRSFWLNRKGRVVADLAVANFADRTILELDVHAGEETFATLDAFLFTEDVEMTSLQESHVQLRLHGPLSLVAISELLGDPAVATLEGATEAVMADLPLFLFRSDDTGEPGVVLICRREDVGTLWDHLLGWESSDGKRSVRPIGWEAYNAARIEGGTPLFNIDFGPDCMPHETGLLEERVSFTKGCYLGQEIVARMQNLGQPRQILRALDLEGDRLPVAGTQVFASLDGADGQPQMGPQIGVVTSSTISPMLGARPVAFAMLRFDYAATGAGLILSAEGEPMNASVRDGLAFLPGQQS